MLDLFTIFTKGGIVLWYFQGTALSLTPAVNALIKSVILQERGGMNAFNHEALTMKFKMDNEFELILVAVYQKAIQLSYIDKLLDQVLLAFRDKYKNELSSGPFRMVSFSTEFHSILKPLEAASMTAAPKPMRRFDESVKAEKALPKATPIVATPPSNGVEDVTGEGSEGENGDSGGGGSAKSDKLKKLQKRRNAAGNKKKPQQSPKPAKPVKRAKADRKWQDGSVSRQDAEELNCSKEGGASGLTEVSLGNSYLQPGEDSMKDLKPLEPDPAEGEEPNETMATGGEKAGGGGGGMFSFFKALTGGKVISREAMAATLDKMKEHLMTKNVAAEIAEKLCDSVAAKLEGKVIGTFSGIQSTVRASIEESLVQILSPKRRVDVLHDVMATSGRPYVITFCGVNGVGKSTNLAKIAFWLLENGQRVLIAACDTFRSGAVEQLRTHTMALSARHPGQREGAPPRVMLYDKGYGKDAAGVAMEAIHYAQQQCYDVVLVDTAGRMQDNEPLMRSLAKLIRVNTPDLVLFVGEALVGNEAVDQLVKFNRALVDQAGDREARIIDGILLTKFDTIDDKVGAAISMTYTTGQPIVFIGTGQRYSDLRSLNVQAVVAALFK